MRIAKDYNQYVMRNLDRGLTRKDLGISYVREMRLRVNMGLKKLRERVKEHQEKVGEKRYKLWPKYIVVNEWRMLTDWLLDFLRCLKKGTVIRDRIKRE